MLIPGTDWLISYALGIVVVLMFSWERLNRPLATAKSNKQRRQRLTALLAPAQMRSPHVFMRGYVFYTLLLLVIYTLGSLGFAGLGLFVDPPQAGETINLRGAEWPLTMALIMIGLAPGLPPLARLEEKFRRLAHMLVGVPANLHAFADALMGVELDRDKLGYDLVGPGDAARLAMVLEEAEKVLGSGTQFEVFSNNAMKLFAARAWAFGGTEWPSYQVRREFSQIEEEITPVMRVVIEDLEDLATNNRFGLKANPAMRDEPGDERLIANQSRWRSIAERVEASAEDICVLFALYAERAATPPVRDNPISALLRELIELAQASRRETRPQDDILLAGLLTVTLAAFAIGYVGGKLGILYAASGNAFDTGFSYLIGVAIFYGPTSVMAWNARHPVAPKVWINPWRGTGVFPTGQFLSLFFWAFVVSFTAMALFTLGGLLMSHVSAIAGTTRGFDGACVARQFLGVAFMQPPGAEACEPQSRILVAVAYGFLGPWNAINLARMADLVEAGLERTRTGFVVIASHALGLGLLTYLAAEFLGRLTPQEGFEATFFPRLGIEMNAAQELVTYEILSAMVLGVLFALVTRAALVRLRDGGPAGAARLSQAAAAE